MDFAQLDLAFGVDEERAAQRQAFFFNHHAKVAGDGTGGVANHHVLHFLDGIRRIGPGFVGEVGVGRNGIHLDAQLLELCVFVGQVFQLSRADEREIGGVEHNQRPFAFEVFVANGKKALARLIRLGVEWQDGGVDERHGMDSCRGKNIATQRQIIEQSR